MLPMLMNVHAVPLYSSRSGIAPEPQRMGPVSASEQRRGKLYTAQVLEQKYRVAMGAGNGVALRAIIKALIDLLSVGQGEDAPFDETNKKREELEDEREEILRNAPTAGNVLRLGRPGGGPPPMPHPGRGRLQRIGPNTYVVIDEEVIDVDAAEGEGGEEGEGD